MFIPLHDANPLENIRLQFVTLALIAINVIIWLITATPQVTDAVEASSIYYSYGFVPAVVNDFADLPHDLAVLPPASSYLTYAFLHGSFMHLAGNMLFLWVFGDNVEDAMGHLKFLIFYLICAAIGAWAHAFMVPQSEIPLVGASGATAGIVGAYIMLHPRVKVWILALGRIPLRLPAYWVLGAWFAFQLYNVAFNSNNDVSWAAHVGGFIAGALLVFLFKKRGVRLFDADLDARHPNAVKSTNKATGKAKPTDSPHKWGRS